MKKNEDNRIKLHLGCGNKYIPGFIHIDAIKYNHVDYICNVDNLSIFTDETVDLIYNCHVLEHFHRNKTLKVLIEWYRVLKKGGVLRVAVPDFEKLSDLYHKTKDLSLVIGPIMGRQSYLYNIHYNLFDFETLKKVLFQAEFKKVKKYDWRLTEHSSIDDYSQSYYPHMDKENGLLMSLNVEATK